MNKKQNLVKGVLFFVLSSVDMYTQTSPESVAEVKTDRCAFTTSAAVSLACLICSWIYISFFFFFPKYFFTDGFPSELYHLPNTT